MNKKKGFSLVEVLAVIAVLAIIALIAVPLVGNQIESSRRAAFKDSVLEASKGLNIYLNRKQIKMIPGIEDGAGVSIETLKKEDLISKLISGRFVEIDDKVYAYFISDGNYCAYGPIDDLTVSKECEDLDPTAPIIEKDAFRLTSTTNSITVTVDEKKIYDNEFNDVTYTLNVYLKSKKKKSQKQIDGQNIYTFEGLKANTEYSVELVATNSAMKQSKQSKKISTFALKKPDFVVEPEGYAFQKNITIKYHNDNITNPKYYFKVIGDNNIVEITNNVKKCFNSSSNIFRPDPNSCNETTNKINGNTWYQTDDMNQVMILKKNAIIIANIYDGVNYSDSNASLLVTSIDNTPPTNVDFSYIVRNNTITLVANGIDLNSGIYGYQFYLDGIGWTDIKTSNTYTFSPVLLEHTYKAKVRAINNTYDGKNLNKKSYADSKEKEIKTGNKPTIICSTKDKGWTKEKTYTCKFPEGNYSNEYIRYSGNSIPDTTKDENWNLYPSESNYSFKFEKEGTEYLILRVVDGLNKIDYVTYAISQIDRTAPTCNWQGESTKWRKGASIILGCEDKLSNGQDGSGCATAGSSWTYTAGEVKTKSLSYTLKDNVGNSIECSKTANIYSDNVAPTCSLSGESTKWRKNATIILTCNDSGSGCSGNTSRSASFGGNGNTTIKQSKITETFVDNAGNEVKCDPTADIYVDDIKPTCKYSGESTTWKKSAIITTSCKDNENGSECDTNFPGWSHTINQTTITYTRPAPAYTIKDNAGNEETCKSKFDAYVDTTPPTISNTNLEVKGTTVKIKFDASDANSGIKKKVCIYGEGSLKQSFTVTGNECAFNNIDDASKYIFAVQVEDNVGNTTKVDINGVNIDFSTSSANTCTTNKSTSIIYSKGLSDTAIKYFKVTNSNITSNSAVYECGNGSAPGTCSSTATTTLKSQYWYKTENDPTLAINNQTDIIATIFDKGKQVISKSLTITQIDSTAPTITATIYKYQKDSNNNWNIGDKIAGPISTTTSDNYIINKNWANYGYYFDIKISDTGCGSDSLTRNWNWNNSGNTSTSSGMEPTNKSTFSTNNYTPTLTANGIRTAEVVVTDGVGNTTKYSFSGFIDTDAPSKPTIKAVVENTTTEYTAGSWTNKNITITASSSDTASGVAKIQYTYNKVDSQTVWKDDFGTLTKNGNTASVTGTWNSTTNGVLLVRAIDNLGNVSEISGFSLKIDKNAPTLKIALYAADSSGNKTGGVLHTYDTNIEATNTWMKNGYYLDVKTNSSDTGSGIASMKWEWNKSEIYDNSSYKTLPDSKSNYIIYDEAHDATLTASGKRYGKITLTDKAGNKTTRTVDVYVDNTAPTISSFYVNGKTLTAKSQDLGSGIVAYAFTTKSTKSADSTWTPITKTNNTLTETYTATSNGKWYFHVKDAAGNVKNSAAVDVTEMSKKLSYNSNNTGDVRVYCGTGWCTGLKQQPVNTKCGGKVHVQAYYEGAKKYQIQDNSTSKCKNNPTVANCCSSPGPMSPTDNTNCTTPWNKGSITIGQETFSGTKDAYKCVRACFDDTCTSTSEWTVVHVQNNI